MMDPTFAAVQELLNPPRFTLIKDDHVPAGSVWMIDLSAFDTGPQARAIEQQKALVRPSLVAIADALFGWLP